MSQPLKLPLAVAEIPESIRKFCDPNAPEHVRMMAARGLGGTGLELVPMLLQLQGDPSQTIAMQAKESIAGLPLNIVATACQSALHPAFLDALETFFGHEESLLEALVANSQVDSRTIERIAQKASEMLCERIATNENRLLKHPKIIEALYMNPRMRMSTADRLVDLAVRNNVDLDGIPAFRAHAEAIRGQIFSRSESGPSPTDQVFRKALSEDANDPEAVERDLVDGSEEIKSQFKPLSILITELNNSQKIRLATVGNAAARSLLVRDTNKQVAFAAISSPRATEAEAATFARSKEISEEILRYIGNRREWLRNYEVKHALVFNPKTPIGISLKFLSHMRDSDLKILSRSRNVSQAIKASAAQRIAKKEKSGG